MRRILGILSSLCLVAMLLPALTLADTQGTSWITLAWDANSESDLAGYRLYQTTVSGQYIKVVVQVDTPYLAEEVGPGTTQVTLSGIEDGTYHWVVTAFDEGGNESDLSNEVSMTFDTYVDLAPAAPQGLRKVDSGTD